MQHRRQQPGEPLLELLLELLRGRQTVCCRPVGGPGGVPVVAAAIALLTLLTIRRTTPEPEPAVS